ncbi:hypothetical protein RRG08_054935 [Elysia crispata]|uniref:Uncharacterized protein n=1 Tax=Elysia crispata TaxID=231223 RepID=A0AAE0YXR0_9GAST|nr:hypothetical protein RRG08_054935 [Elysia crispata]
MTDENFKDTPFCFKVGSCGLDYPKFTERGRGVVEVISDKLSSVCPGLGRKRKPVIISCPNNQQKWRRVPGFRNPRRVYLQMVVFMTY